MESYTFEVMQYSAYRFRLPPTPGMQLVQFKHDQQGQQRYGPQSTQTGLDSSCPVSNFFPFLHIPIFHNQIIKTSYISRVTGNYSTSTESYF